MDQNRQPVSPAPDIRKLVVLTGPTAVGKTRLSILLAKRIGGEIISADSMQVYRKMDIGSAKIRPEEMDGIMHHLIDVLDPSEPFDVVRFQSLAKKAVGKITSRGHIPILVGGTGFYIQSVVYDIDLTQNDGDDSYRRMLQSDEDCEALHEMLRRMDPEMAAEVSPKDRPAVLHALLRKVDPDAAARIHPNNTRRTIRALEFHHQTGDRISEHNVRERAKESPYRHCYFVLTQDRAAVYARIDSRVDRMLEDGLEDEVRQLKAMGLTPDMTSMKGLGYAEMLRYLDGEISYEETVRLIKRNTRHFAKRQLTWFRRERDVIRIDRDDYGCDDERILEAMLRELSRKGIV